MTAERTLFVPHATSSRRSSASGTGNDGPAPSSGSGASGPVDATDPVDATGPADLIGPAGATSGNEVATGWLALRSRPVLLAVSCAVVALGVGYLLPTKPKDALALLAGIAVVAVVLLRPIVGAVLLVALVPATSGLATGFPVSNVRLSEAVIGIVGVTLLASVRRQDAVPWEALDWALLVYGLLWAAFAMLADRQLHQHLTISDWGTAVGQLQFFLVYRGVRVAVRSQRERRIAVVALLVASLPVCLLGILQELKAPGVQSLINTLTGGLTAGTAPTGAGSIARITGPFANWAAFAGYLLPIVLVVVALALARSQLRRSRWFLAVALASALALVLTIEQSAIACAVLGILVLLRRYDQDGKFTRWFLVGIAVVILAASPLLVGRVAHELAGSPGSGRVPWVPQTLSFRWSVWTKQYFPAIGARPLSGYGIVYPTSISWSSPESQYVSLLMEGGIVVLLAFGVLAWVMLRRAWQAVQGADPLDRALGWAVLLAVVAMLVMNVTWPFLSNGGMPQVLWALAALLMPRRRDAGERSGAVWRSGNAILPANAIGAAP